MLTTTVDGLWVLQVLSGIEVLSPELGLRPHLPSVETKRMALAHPVATELRAAGAITDSGEVDGPVLEWLTVLSRRDVTLLVYAQTPANETEPERVLLARFAQWWVALERSGIAVRISGAGTATSENSAGMLINSQLERLCDEMKPASLRPVTLDVAELLGAVRDQGSLRSFLLRQETGRRSDHRPDPGGRHPALGAGFGRRHPVGRVQRARPLAHRPGRGHDHRHTAGQAALRACQPRRHVVDDRQPGSSGNIANAVQKMVRRLPAEDEWYSHRKVV